MTRIVDRIELLRHLRDGDATIVEVLGPMYFDDAHLPGAINIPVDLIDTLAPTLLPDTEALIVVYCSDASCDGSQIAGVRLEELGYRNVAVYSEGKLDWIEHGLPVERQP